MLILPQRSFTVRNISINSLSTVCEFLEGWTTSCSSLCPLCLQKGWYVVGAEWVFDEWRQCSKWPLSQTDSCISEDLQTHGIRETCNLLPVFLPCHKWVLLQVSVKALPCPFACPSGLSVRGKVMGLADKIGMEDQGWLVYPLPGSLFA